MLYFLLNECKQISYGRTVFGASGLGLNRGEHLQFSSFLGNNVRRKSALMVKIKELSKNPRLKIVIVRNDVKPRSSNSE